MTDEITTEKPVPVLYPLHTLVQPEPWENGFTLTRENCRLQVQPLEGLTLDSISDQFGVDLNDGEPAQYHVTMRPQYHVYFKAEPRCHHCIQVRYHVVPTE